MTKPYMVGEAKSANVVHDVGIPNGDVITYKAVTRDGRGLRYDRPIIMLQLSRNGCKSGWVDADLISSSVNEHRESLIDRIDSDFIPTSEWEIKV